ncbi:MAG: glycosyltransferase family 2 protein [Clostridia bacterium]|nr:glycosyltransferase family 2 protein [Clostridia bacterium]
MQKELISIIIPCFNVGRFLEECCKSLANQTNKNFEVIFVNDGSTDDTLDIIKEICEENENYRYVDQQNQGVSGARNTGIQNANGEFVCFIDADDILSPFYLETLHSNITKFDADYSVGKLKFRKESFSNEKVSKKKKNTKPALFEGKQEILSQLYSTGKFNVSVCNKLYRISILKSMETYPNIFSSNITYGEDLDFNFRYLTKCETAIFTKQPVYNYRMRKGSAVQSRFKEKMLSVFVGHYQNLKTCEEKNPEVVKYVRAFIAISALEMLFRMFYCKYDKSEKIVELYREMKANNKYIRKSKKIPWYKKLSPCARPILRILLSKHFRKLKRESLKEKLEELVEKEKTAI